MNKYLNLGLFGLFVIGGVLASGVFATPLGSVAQGNVYDIYATSNGVSTLAVHCGSFAQMLSLQAANPSINYSAIPNAACGTIVLVTSTTILGTTFTNNSSGCPPGTALAQGGACTTTTSTTVTVATCGNVIYNPQTASCNTTSTSTSLGTTVITATGSGTTSTLVVTTNNQGGGSGISNSQTTGLGLSGLSLIGLIFFNRKGIRSAL